MASPPPTANPEQKILKFVWEHKRPQVGKAILRNKNGAGGIRPPDFRLHGKATVITAVRCWHKNRNTEQNGKSSRKPHNCSQSTSNRGGKSAQWRSSLQQVTPGNWTATCRRVKLEHSLTPHTK